MFLYVRKYPFALLPAWRKGEGHRWNLLQCISHAVERLQEQNHLYHRMSFSIFETPCLICERPWIILGSQVAYYQFSNIIKKFMEKEPWGR